ncbi:MAG: hypothetical protein GY769_25770 [bacterium]|nr:hypothetical protein [bacterium]
MNRPRSRWPRRWMMQTCAGLACLLALSGCALVKSHGNRLFADRDFAGARDAYLELLERRDGGRRVENALYHLGLIYLQPERDLYDPKAAEAVLVRLSYIRPRSEYAAKAALLLALHLETSRLREDARAQNLLRREVERELASLREEATQTEARSEDQSKKVDQLGGRIGRLQSQIVKLREELAATEEELVAREQELERLKRIDLEDPE